MVSASMLMYQVLGRSDLLHISHYIFRKPSSHSCTRSNSVCYISIAAVKCQDQEQFKEEKIDFGSKFWSAGGCDGWEGMRAEGQCKVQPCHLPAAYGKQRGGPDAGVRLNAPNRHTPASRVMCFLQQGCSLGTKQCC